VTDRGELLAEGREAEVFAAGDGTVLKLLRDPDHAWRVQREAAALRALEAEGYPAPRVVGEVSVDGRPGLELERVDGRDQLAMIGRRPLSVFTAGRVLGEAHVAMHDCAAPDDLPDLHDDLRRRIEAAEALPDDLRRRALDVLRALPRGDRLCHGDLHPGNILGPWAAPVVIDWGDASRGDPTADVARTAVLLRVGEPPPGSPVAVRTLAGLGRRILHDRYLATYRARRAIDRALLDRWQIVRAAGRLWEPVPDEHPALLGVLRAGLAGAAA
jgi:aminoglycoside phosphotransferase (APT) family kinase protein